MDRRDFLKQSGGVVAGGLLADLGIMEQAAGAAAKSDRRPNIILILVDEMRFPSVFPGGIRTPEQFLARYMPNLFELWRHGVKFERYYSAGNACSPARATIHTGLYPHQQWLLATRTPGASPSLQTGFPTYGRLLRQLGYQTPYVGKWHLSNAPSNGSTAGYLENYGFQGMTNPDPIGYNGEGASKDGPVIADRAVTWLEQNARKASPFCLTVSFVNPHDRQFFWAGSEADRYYPLFPPNQPLIPFNPGPKYSPVPGEENPMPLGFPTIPPNWESYADLPRNGKPTTQQVFRSFQEAVWGGAPDDAGAATFTMQPSPIKPRTYGVGIAPYSYWQRGLDMYTLVQQMVDQQIGRVVAAIPKAVRANTVIVFASDHGEYAGAHGLLAGKIGTAYEEAIHVPLVVTDFTHRFAKRVEKPRAQMASSVDLLPMLVTLGNGGSTSWRRGQLARIYGERLNLVELLRNPNAAGRDHILFATDEIVPDVLNYLHAPTHVLAVRTSEAKLVTYTKWFPGTTRPIPASLHLEFYDYATAQGRAETRSHPDDRRAKAMARKLFTQYVPRQMEAPLPPPLKKTVAKARASYVAFVAKTNAGSIIKALQALGYGGPF
ncbi:MAG: sulfatase-like hydrolase/transferase [Solirubrobacterales bacterium]|nr:sulfatase-like hydrolase/transferase [Solirubrobacterales bacterium]